MMIRWLFAVSAVLLLFAAGCSSSGAGGKKKTDEGSREKQGFISGLDDRKVLVNDIYYFVDENTLLITDGGKKLAWKDLQLGMKAEPWYTGGIRESYPMQADAVKIVILTDEESKKEQEAAKAAVEYAQKELGKPIIIEKVEPVKDQNTLRIEVRSVSEGSVNLEYDFQSKTIWQEKQAQGGIRERPGFIAGLYDRHILIGDISYFVDENSLLETDGGKKLAWSDLQLGMKAEPWHNGVMESYPGKADAIKLVIFTDKESQREQEAVRAAVEHADKEYGQPILIKKAELAKDRNTMRMELRSFAGGTVIYHYDYQSRTIRWD